MASEGQLPPPEQYCEHRDRFHAKLERLRRELTQAGSDENDAFLLHALLSEIGGNSFDHNIGQWKDMPGVYFAHEIAATGVTVVLADRGQGILTTLRRVRPGIASDEEALRVAFLERISGRSPERRGNGLKFVRETIMEDSVDLFFQSGTATYAIERKQERWEKTDTHLNGCFAILTFPR